MTNEGQDGLVPFRAGADGVEDAALHAIRLHALFDHLPALIAYWDRDGRNVIANSRYLEWFGRTPEQMHGLHISEVLGPEVYAKNIRFIEGALRGEEQLFERTLIDTAGRIRHTQASYVPDVIDDQTVGFFALVTDVTPRVEAQRAMDEAQRLARLGSWTLDVETGAVAWSAELYRMLGVDPDSFVPTVDAFMERVDARDVERVGVQLQRALEDGEDYDQTYRLRGAEGRQREVHSQGNAERGRDGRLVRLTGTLQDVTESNAAARELSRVNDELRNMNQLNADVLAMLGHDVRAPLSVVLGFLEVLTDAWEEFTDSERREQLDRAFRAASRLKPLVDDILALATVDSGQLAADALDLRAVDLVREAVASVALGLDISITWEGDPRVLADGFHVRQVVSNLVTNAIRYGKPPVQVHVEASDADSVTITVSDHGTGVPEHQVDSLFERFGGRGQGQQPVVTGASTGFGLYIAARLAAANGGTLTYAGAGTGAQFCLRLPRAEVAPTQGAA